MDEVLAKVATDRFYEKMANEELANRLPEIAGLLRDISERLATMESLLRDIHGSTTTGS